MSLPPGEPTFRSVHYWAWFTAAWALLVVSIGGLVTSKGVGMAVPDWPTTYGYNMFFFPISQWTGGIFHEHVHRLVASLLGLWTIVLALGLQWGDSRRWVRALGWLALGLVVVQGVLGGKRVVLNAVDVFGIPGSVFFGVLHATTAQVFLSILATILLVTNPSMAAWMSHESIVRANGPERRMGPLLAVMATLVFVQLTVAATMRHQHAGLAVPDFPLAYGQVYPDTAPDALATINQRRMGIVDDAPVTAFHVHLHMVHRFVALGLVTGAAWTWRKAGGMGGRWKTGLRAWCCLFAIQFALGAATVWTNKAADLATAHVAVGAMILATGTALAASRFMAERCSAVAFDSCGAGNAFIKPSATVALGRPA